MTTYDDAFELPDFDPSEDRSHPDERPDTVGWAASYHDGPLIYCTGSVNERIAAFHHFRSNPLGVQFIMNPERAAS